MAICDDYEEALDGASHWQDRGATTRGRRSIASWPAELEAEILAVSTAGHAVRTLDDG